MTYRELNLAADRIAGVLRGAGVAAGDMVGVLLDRSPDIVAGLLGIWKAGGSSIPLDPAAPPKRLAFMLEDCAPRLCSPGQSFLIGSQPRSSE